MPVFKLSTLPPVSAVRPDANEFIQADDLIEVSISGTPGTKFYYGTETGYFSSTGWASVKCSRNEFLQSTSGTLLKDISGAIFSETDSGGAYRNSGVYLVLEIEGSKYYLPLYVKIS